VKATGKPSSRLEDEGWSWDQIWRTVGCAMFISEVEAEAWSKK
jgi:hypothetical protein